MPSGVPEQESGSSLVQILVRALVILHISLILTYEKAIETAIQNTVGTLYTLVFLKEASILAVLSL